jgi:hypothetical protein
MAKLKTVFNCQSYGKWKCTIKCFIAFFLLFAALAPYGHIPPDSQYSLETARALYKNHSFAIDKTHDLPNTVTGRNGAQYSKYGIGYAICFLPVVTGADLFAKIIHIDTKKAERFFACFFGALSVAILVCILNALLLGLGYSEKNIFRFLTFISFGSILLPYSKLILVETPTAALLTLCFWLLFKRQNIKSTTGLWLGITISFLILLKITSIIYAGIFGSYLLFLFIRKRAKISSLLLFAGTLAMVIIFLLFMNKLRFGSLFNFGYGGEQSQFTTPFFRGLFGLVLSPSKSFLIYSPLMIPAILAWPVFFRNHKELSVLILISFFLILIFHSPWHSWYGGWSWGPRLIVPTLILAHIPLVEYISLMAENRAHKILFYSVLPLAICIQMLGTSINYQEIHEFIPDASKLNAPHISIAGKLFIHKLKGLPEVYEFNGKTLDFRDRETFQGFGNMWIGMVKYSEKHLQGETF